MKRKLLKKSVIHWALIIGLMLCLSTAVMAANDTAAAEDEIGIAYRGHVQNQGNMPKPEGTMVSGPDALGTRGQSLRVEGFWLDLSGDLPEGAKLVYQVHVENRGWMTPVSDGDFAGTAGESLRVESIRIKLENLPGYDVYYRGHVQNVGDIPQVDGQWDWVKNGADLGTTGSSLRLEELQVKIVKQPAASYDKAGTYGPKTGEEIIDNDVTVKKDGVVLQNLHIKGNLTIAEEVGEGDVTLNNVIVDGETYVRGGGKNSIHINGGDYNKITVMQTSSGQVRIVATNAKGLEVVVSEAAKGEDIILEGAFKSVTIDAPDVKIATQGDTTIKELQVAKNATDSQITLDKSTTVEKLSLNAGVDMKGEGAVKEANVNSDNVTFEKAPDKANVAPEVSKPPVVTPPVVTPPVVTPPVVPPAPDPGGGGGGGGGVSSEDLLVAEYTNATTIPAFVTLLDKNALNLDLNGYATLDTAGKELVGSLLLKQDSFASKAVVQATVKTAIASAVADMQNRARTDSINAYAKALTIDASNAKFTVTYAGLDEAFKPGLSGYYADALLSLDNPLESGDVITINAFGAEIPVTNELVTGTQIRLSELLKLTYTDANLAANQSGSFEISITNKVLTNDHFISARAILVKGDEVIELENYNAMMLRRPFVDAYTSSLTFPPSGTLNEVSIQYGGLTDPDKSALAGYYADTLITMGQTLTEGESFTLNALGKQVTITSATPSFTQVRLSSLLSTELDDSQLAANKTGIDTIFASSITLNDVVNVNIQPVLVKTDGTIVFLQKTNNLTVVPIGSDGLTPTCLADYTESFQKSGHSEPYGAGSVVFSHYRDISDATKGILREFYADVMITLNRPLATGETVIVQAYGKEINVGSDKITEAGGTKIRLSELVGQTLGAEQLAINMNNDLYINVVDLSLVNPITVTAVPMLVKDSIVPQYLDVLASEIALTPWSPAADIGVSYCGFVDSWDSEWTSDGQALGIPDSNPGYDAVKLQLTGIVPAGGKITYETFGPDQTPGSYKWYTAVSDGAISGNDTLNSSSAPLEAIKISLENVPGYSVMYQAYVQGRGWQEWMSNGEIAGTTGCAQQIKALRVRIIKN